MSGRRHRLVGVVSAVGAFLAVSTAAPAANADFDDLFEPLLDAISAIDPGIAADTDPGSALASLDALFDSWYQDLVYTPIHDIAPWLFGSDVAGSAAASYDSGTPLADLPSSFTVPMDVNGYTEPVVGVSVGGGPSTDVLVDTGASGLVMPIWDIPWWNGTTGLPTGFNFGFFGSSLGYFYAEMPSTVTFTDAAGDTVSADTTVDAVLFSFPINLTTLLNGHWSIETYLGGHAEGVLGIGPNALGPNPGDIPTAGLPGALGHGVLIDQANGELVFGDRSTLMPGGTEVPGAPYAHLQVSINGGPQQEVGAVVDSGGVYGTMPKSVLGDVTPTANGHLPNGTTVEVYTNDGETLLYSYTVNMSDPEARSPIVVDGDGATMNTGNYPFAQQPVYISYTPAGPSQPTWDVGGITIFGGVNPNTIAP